MMQIDGRRSRRMLNGNDLFLVIFKLFFNWNSTNRIKSRIVSTFKIKSNQFNTLDSVYRGSLSLSKPLVAITRFCSYSNYSLKLEIGLNSTLG